MPIVAFGPSEPSLYDGGLFDYENVYNDARFCHSCQTEMILGHDFDTVKCIPCLGLAQECWQNAYMALLDENDSTEPDAKDRWFYEDKISRINKARIDRLTDLLNQNNIKIQAQGGPVEAIPDVQPEAEEPEPEAEAEAAHTHTDKKPRTESYKPEESYQPEVCGGVPSYQSDKSE